MRHDPERNAAAYLDGLLSGARRRTFERHILDCDECWQEVDLGRNGRAVAESARELAPQALRERVRAAVETVTPRRRGLRWALAGIAIVVAVLAAAATLLPQRDPPEIQAALAAFRADAVGDPAEPELPTRLGHLELVGSNYLDGVDAVAHRYVDGSGDEVMVYVADKEWPVAVGAEHDNAGETWLAERDGLVLICLNEPEPSLVVGVDVRDVEGAAYSLRP